MSCLATSSAPMPRANVPAAIDWPALRSMPAPATASGAPEPGRATSSRAMSFRALRISGAASTGNRVVANLIGTNRSGDAALANGSKVEDGDGIRIDGGRFNVIGGRTAAERNILSGNHDDGI